MILRNQFYISALSLKAPITTAAGDIHECFFIVFSEKIRLDVSGESSAYMKTQALFSAADDIHKCFFIVFSEKK